MGNGLETFRLFIGGKAVDAVSGRTFQSQNPYTGQPWAELADGGPEDVDLAVQSARAAFEGEWGARTGFERAAIMRDVAAAISDNAERLALLEVRDSGKLMREMRGQLEALGNWYLYYSGLADKLEGKTVPAVAPQTYFGYTVREPVGVVAAITPWNSPLLLLTWKLAPLLAAGCTCVAKPSEHSPASTAAFAEVLYEAGLPAGVFNVVTGLSRETGAALSGHPGVDKVAFTGSTATGVSVARAAVANVNRVTLELGGKSPQVVFGDADLDAAANGVVAGVFAATGQTCMAGSRLIVHESVRDQLIAKVVARAESIKQGDPTQADTEMGNPTTETYPEEQTGLSRLAEIGPATAPPAHLHELRHEHPGRRTSSHRVVNAATGELLRDLVLDPSRGYQPSGAPKEPADDPEMHDGRTHESWVRLSAMS